jgi:hypothetical protein
LVTRKNFEEITVKLIGQTLLISCGLFIASQVSFAQSVNAYFGVGTATDGSSGASIDPFGTGNPFTTPKITGTFLDAGATVMLTKHYGAGADINWRASQGNYAGLLYRPVFYNFDGVWTPVSTKRFEPEVHLGLGGMHLGYSFSQTNCNEIIGCNTSTESVGNSNHFQVHGALAARLYLTDHVFVRPAIDAHFVNNNFQFGSNWVPEYSVALGYSFGRE